MQRLLLVRHAAPVIDPSVPSVDWVLSPEGEEAARRLAQDLGGRVRGPIYSSAETKAVQTARVLAEECGVQAEIEGELREVEGRSWVSTQAAYKEIAARYLGGEAVSGWEDRTEAQRRIVAAVQRLMGLRTGRVRCVARPCPRTVPRVAVESRRWYTRLRVAGDSLS